MATMATEEGTARYEGRLAGRIAAGHLRRWPRIGSGEGFRISSLGIGTSQGAATDDVDAAYSRALRAALEAGVNVVDTAISYRHMRSERLIGRTLTGMFADGGVARDEVWVMSKGGYLPFDGDLPPNPSAYLRETYLTSGLVPSTQLSERMHCLDPSFLTDQLARSLDNLGLETLDVYFIHNPEEQLRDNPRAEFMLRLAKTFYVCERAVRRGQIRYYGLATSAGLRVERSDRLYLDLDEILRIATSVGGADHHLRVLQLPVNSVMNEALVRVNQTFEERPCTAIEAAFWNDMLVFSHMPLLRGEILSHVPAEWTPLMPDLRTPATRALQFVRSMPGITSALVGMKDPRHVAENLVLCQTPPLAIAPFEGPSG
ncbi:MAG: aldo/keto reductase [Myxococcales bacterium]|nr:aldo/keto reductase [Myxococcales bacterium]